MKHRKWLALCLTAALGLGMTGCNGVLGAEDDRIRIVCTNFAAYDWTKHLLPATGEAAYEVTYLLDNGTDSHSFQPSAADIAKISSCDLFIYVGGESEQWAYEAAGNAVNEKQQTVCLMDAVNALEEETVEGMEADEHDHDHEDEHDEEHEEHEEHDEAPEFDEHIWLSVKNAEACCQAISDQLCAVDAEHAEDYRHAQQHYEENLAQLDAMFADLAQQTADKTLIVADRFPFRYFVEDYGYEYYAAFAGCSAETEASFETIAFLAQKIDELGTQTIFNIEGGNTGLAEAVRDNTQSKDQTIATLNSLQSVTQEDINGGATYLDLMTENLQVLKEAAGLQ